MELQNGRKLISFVRNDSNEHRTPLGLGGGPALDRGKNAKLLMMPLDRIYPIQDLGTNPAEVGRRAASGEGTLDGADGYCFFSSHDILAAKELSCVARHQHMGKTILFNVRMEANHISFQSIPTNAASQ